MNNEQQTSQGPISDLNIEQRRQLIKKLRTEYDDLKGKVGRLHAFLCDIDFEKRVPDPEERSNLREQLGIMLSYLENLRRRISFHEVHIADQMINEATHRIEIKGMREGRPIDRGIGVSCHNCGKSIRPCDVYTMVEGNPFCITCAAIELMKRVPLAPMPHHCGQDVSSESSESSPSSENDKPVITGESLKKLMDYQVVGVCEPGFPCEGCVQDQYNTPCVKVELVGGYMLCLAPLPNSIMMDKPCS